MNKQSSVHVWDILIRIFHWSLVVSFTVAYLTSEEENLWHVYSGYTVLGLIIFRLIWGFIGSQHARFSDFVRSPSVVKQYAESLLTDRPQHYVGHNPLGGWMVVAMLLMLFVVTVSGLKVYAIEEGKGPLAGAKQTQLIPIAEAFAEEDDDEENRDIKSDKVYKADEEFWEEIHEASSNLMLLLVALHLFGVIVSSRLHRENLVKAMLTGKKDRQ